MSTEKPTSTVIVDAGNSHTKTTFLEYGKLDYTRISFASVVADLGTDHPDLPKAPTLQADGGLIIHYSGHWWAVGKIAESYPQAVQVRGGKRYETLEWKVLIAAAILATVKDSRTVDLYIAIPLRGGTPALNAVEKIEETMVVWSFHPTGNGNTGMRTFRISNKRTMHETEGAYYYHILDANCEYRDHLYYQGLYASCADGLNELRRDGILMGDGGGWTFDVLPVQGLHPVIEQANTLRGQMGLNNVKRELQHALQEHKVVGGGNDWPEHLLDEALIPNSAGQFQIRFGSRMVGVRDSVQKAINKLVLDLAEYAIRDLDGGRSYVNLILTGGAAQAVYPWLMKALADQGKKYKITNHYHVLKPDISVPAYYHNIEGMVRFTRKRWYRLYGQPSNHEAQ